jgi:RNA ligase
MSIFKTINHIDDLLPYIKDKPEINVVTHANGCKVISYMFQDSKTFAGDYEMWLRECRGITFLPDGSVGARPFHKFFNVNEKVNTKEENIDWSSIINIADKRDGSMITPVWFPETNTLVYKTKKSFDNDISQTVNALFGENTVEYELCIFLTSLNCTPIFEYTAPSNRIVLKYNQPSLTLLAIRHNNSGVYWTYETMQALLSTQYPEAKLVDSFATELSNNDWLSKLKEKLTVDQLFEGYVFESINGERYKWKSVWYELLHRNVTFPTYQSIAEMVIDEKVDDFKAYCVSIEDNELYDKIEVIESQVFEILKRISQTVELNVSENKELEVKDFCLKFKDDPLFHLMIAFYKNKEVNYIDYFRKYVLEEQFSRDSV